MSMASLKTCVRASVNRYFTRSLATEISNVLPSRGDRVVVGMSGGVDSSVAAALAAEKDYDLSAVFMRNWDTRDESGTDKGCEWEKDWEDVQRTCRVLDIPCQMIDLSREYWNRVFEPSLKLWEAGQTPNPDVWCNREIKFGALLAHLPMQPSDTTKLWLATGHYARKSWSNPISSHELPRPKLLSGKDIAKDQSYYLSSITEEGLSRALFPLGDLTKVEVRELARKYRLPTAEKAESMGLCFVGEKAKFNKFLSDYLPPKPGPILHGDEVVGEHQGLWNYTIGQGARILGMKEKMYVARKNTARNAVYIVPGKSNPAILVDTIHAVNWAWIWADSPPEGVQRPDGLRAMLRVRHRMTAVPCTVKSASPGQVTIRTDEPQGGGVPEGQVAAVWDWDGEWCLGCGLISEATYTDRPA